MLSNLPLPLSEAIAQSLAESDAYNNGPHSDNLSNQDLARGLPKTPTTATLLSPSLSSPATTITPSPYLFSNPTGISGLPPSSDIGLSDTFGNMGVGWGASSSVGGISPSETLTVALGPVGGGNDMVLNSAVVEAIYKIDSKIKVRCVLHS